MEQVSGKDTMEVERDRFGVMFSGPLEVGECIEVVPASELTALRERVEAVQDGLRRLAQGGGSELAKRMGIEMAADHLDAALNPDTQR